MWITEPPNVLFFSLNRVQYDKQEKQIVKNNAFFEFDKVIYADLFMYQNKQRTDKLRDEISKIKDEINLLNESLSKYDNFIPHSFGSGNANGITLYETLDAAQNFLDVNSSNPESVITHQIGGENITVHNP